MRWKGNGGLDRDDIFENKDRRVHSTTIRQEKHRLDALKTVRKGEGGRMGRPESAVQDPTDCSQGTSGPMWGEAGGTHSVASPLFVNP